MQKGSFFIQKKSEPKSAHRNPDVKKRKPFRLPVFSLYAKRPEKSRGLDKNVGNFEMYGRGDLSLCGKPDRLCKKRGIAGFHRNQKTLPVAERQLQLLARLRESRRIIFFHQTFQIKQQVLFRRYPIRFLIALFPNASLASFGRSSFFHTVSP